jgi:superfamily II DNA or RNA helicase
MSIRIVCSTLIREQVEQIDTDLNLTIVSKKNNLPPVHTFLQPYRIDNGVIFAPYFYARAVLNQLPMTHEKNAEKFKFKGQLRDEQKVVRNEAIKILNEQGSLIISTHVGFGKSILAAYFACKIQMKTLIIVNRLTLLNQWVDVLNQFVEQPKIHILKPSEIIDWSCDFFIVNAINLSKFGYMPEIGLVIVDEVHLIVSKILSTCFQYVTPSYLIGLSATPYREDGLDVLLDLYFGKERIDRQLHRKHVVYQIETGFKPIVNKPNPRARVDWNDILNQQALDTSRNQLIVEIVSKLDYNFLILCKRVEQIKILEKMLQEKEINVVALHGSKQPQPDQEAKVLIGTIQKLGVGFDAPYLNALIVAADIESYFIQYLGRVFRKRDIVPRIYDLVDDYSILKKHFNTRKECYLKHGGKILTEENFKF